MIKRVLIDVDGVIANFVEHAITYLTSEKPESVYARWPKGEWNCAKVLAVSDDLFWRTIDTQEFWSTVPVFEDAHEFMEGLSIALMSMDDVVFATSSGGSTAFLAARTAWLREFCRKAKIAQIRTVIFQHIEDKAIAASPETLIIEDSDLGIERFIAAGGHAVRVPRLWNKGVAPADGNVYCSVMLDVANAILASR